MSEKQCPFCCEMIDSYLQKCPFCGERIDVICSYCGNSVSSKAKICPKCARELEPKQEEEFAPWTILSVILMLFYCAICIGVGICIFDPTSTGLPNATIEEKLKNIGDLLFFLLFPVGSSIIACCKKQNISMSVISCMVSVLFCFFAILLVIGVDI